MDEKLNKTSSHEHCKGQEVKTSQLFRQTLIVTSQPSEACCPGEATLDYPSARKQHEAPLCVGQLDHFQSHTLSLGSLSSILTCVALIHKRYLYRAASHFLYLLRQLFHLCSVLLSPPRRAEPTGAPTCQPPNAPYFLCASLLHRTRLAHHSQERIAACGCQRWLPTVERYAPQPSAAPLSGHAR